MPANPQTDLSRISGRINMAEPFPVALEQKARDFIGGLRASVKVRRYAAAYLDHVAHGGPEPQEFKAGHGQPSFSYPRLRIDRILNGDDR
jgi:hypothetical protein